MRNVLRANPVEISADAGFCDEGNLAHLARRRINAFLAPGRDADLILADEQIIATVYEAPRRPRQTALGMRFRQRLLAAGW